MLPLIKIGSNDLKVSNYSRFMGNQELINCRENCKINASAFVFNVFEVSKGTFEQEHK
jgi:hypothetical protein